MIVRTMLLAAAVSAALLTGCSTSPKVTVASPAPQSSSSTKATVEDAAETASEPLDPETCVSVAEAQLDLIVATSSEEATPPAEVLKGYDPPSSVVESIDHLVDTGGIQFDDPDATTHTDTLKEWVEEVCP